MKKGGGGTLLIVAAVFCIYSLIPGRVDAENPDTLLIMNPAGELETNPGVFVDDLIVSLMASEKLAGPPLAGQFPHQRVEQIETDENSFQQINDLFYRRGWTDGIPIVPPTPELVKEMLQATDYHPSEMIGVIEPMRGKATVEKIAINAVMAGAKPSYLPVIIAAVSAIADPGFDLYGVQTTDESVTPLLIINGPVVQDIKINAGFGALGPGWQSYPNAAIGRAVRLVINNIGGAWTGTISLAGIGQPGKYTLCIAENEEVSPWEPLHMEVGYKREASTVTALRAESAYNVFGSGLTELASVMGTLGSRMSARRGYGSVAVLLGPYTAKELAKKGWSKSMVREYLWENGRIPLSVWNEQSYYKDLIPEWAAKHAKKGSIPVVAKPEDIVLFVAGSGLPVPQHVYFPTWVQNHGSGRITKEIRLPAKWKELISTEKQ
jgi:hypothetical protein